MMRLRPLKDVVVTGLGVISCMGGQPRQMFQHVICGESGISALTGQGR